MPRRSLSLAAALAALAPAALAPAALSAQLGSYNPPPGPRQTLAIRGARIVPVSGPELASGTVVVRDGKIAAVGANVAVPAGATIIDGTGLTVYPGMMDAGTSLGLSEIPQGAAATVDVSEVGTFNPNAQAYFGVNPQSAHIGVTRVVGITHVLTRPTGGVVAGQAALLNLAGSTVPEMSVVPRAALVVELPRSGFGGGRFGGGFAFQAASNPQEIARTRTRQLDSLRAMLRDAEAYARAQEAYAKDRALPRPRQDVVLASLVPAARRQMPVLFVADRAADIREAIAFADEMQLAPIIVGGRDAWQVAALLKQKDVPVLLGGVMDLPSREDDPYDVNYSAPAKLAAAGVRFAITSGDAGAEARNLPYTAGMASAFGLAKGDALKAVTLWPAQILGVGDRLGSIEVGKIANLVVTDGDLLEARTQTRHLIIDGRVVPLESKHTDLYERFKDRP